MKITYEIMENWPMLAWLASFEKRGGELQVKVGPGVERTEEWFCEAVWDGDYSDGGFDETDIIFGSGVRVRNNELVFVSSGSTLDRLVFVEENERFHVSNSLCCLMAHLDSGPLVAYPGYFDDLHSIRNGIRKYTRRIPTQKMEMELLYFDNLHWDGKKLSRIEKPGRERRLENFGDYHGFLRNSMAALKGNMEDGGRKLSFSMLATMSSGYDSPTAAALAREVGCTEAITIADSRGGDDDSGSEIAEHLGIDVRVFARSDYTAHPEAEAMIYCGEGEGYESFMGVLTGTLKGRVLLTGFHGDKVWDLHNVYLSDEIVRGDVSGLSVTEWRLDEGFINMPVPFFSCRNARDIARISASEEMKPWDLGNRYNRPICRRILEEKGVPRDAFGVHKKAAARVFFDQPEVMIRENEEDYRSWLAEHRSAWLGKGKLPPSSISDRAAYHFYNTRAKGMRSIATGVSGIPLLWKTQKHLIDLQYRWVLEGAKPSAYRRHVVNWAFLKGMDYYR